MRRGLLVGIAALLVGAAASAEEWELVREEAGTSLYRRDGEPPAFRAVTVIDAPLPHVFAVLRDVPRHVEWRSRCVEAHILSVESNGDAILYSRNRGAWPIADRDSVLRSESRVDGPDAASIALETAESALAPVRDGAVRMGLEGSYALRATEPGRTEVDYWLQIELGGSVPGWIARYATEDMPVGTLDGLRRQVAETAGDYDAFIEAWPEAAARGELPPTGN